MLSLFLLLIESLTRVQKVKEGRCVSRRFGGVLGVPACSYELPEGSGGLLLEERKE